MHAEERRQRIVWDEPAGHLVAAGINHAYTSARTSTTRRETITDEADVVKLIQQAVADGANLIRQPEDAGLGKITKYAWGHRLVPNSYTWMFVIERSGERYGQMVVYYRANNLAPPDSRR
jgi:hypothetical protein